jgi:5,10-methylenetetrahydromethanopterin reductase
VKYGVGLWQAIPSGELAGLVQSVEAWGFDHAWYANHKLYRDMVAGLTIAAVSSRRLEIGSFVAEPYSMHPGQIAAAIATVDELTGGRAILGIGAGGGTLRELGIRRERVATTIRESVDVIHALLRGEHVTATATTTSIDGSLHLPVRLDLPVVVASRGDRVLQVAGEVADGAMVATYATPEGLAHGLAMVDAGRARSSEPDRPFRLLARVDIALNDDGAAARDAVRPMIAMMVMASYPDTAFVEHAGLVLSRELEEMCRQKNEALALESGHLIPDEFVRQFAWTGTVDEVAHRVAEAVSVGFTEIVVLPQPLNASSVDTIRRFALEVIPRVRAQLS